ncbi:MAG: AGE family epimerase/isomerase, partial [Granulosicoccus sp.]|nr:AGE family epimerase/isomerase [Granulosicoccus sp.]
MVTVPKAPADFTDPEFLHAHVRFILDFYEPRVVDPAGGFFQTFRDNGDIYDPPLKHLVSSTRYVWNYANAYKHYGADHHLEWTRHGLQFLLNHHRQSDGHFAWEMRDHDVIDGRAMAYGHAFVMLAAASALEAGIEEAGPLIDDVWVFMEQYFWQPEFNAYADERDASLQILDPYRGQNANMHMCEALLAAFAATSESRYLDRAETLAKQFAVELIDPKFGLIWEHYDIRWNPDMQYNIDKPDDLFKPWGFQPGHQVEWSKLLLQLNQHRPSAWLQKRAIE